MMFIAIPYKNDDRIYANFAMNKKPKRPGILPHEKPHRQRFFVPLSTFIPELELDLDLDLKEIQPANPVVNKLDPLTDDLNFPFENRKTLKYDDNSSYRLPELSTNNSDDSSVSSARNPSFTPTCDCFKMKVEEPH
jgi:hypothetical protein